MFSPDAIAYLVYLITKFGLAVGLQLIRCVGNMTGPYG